MSTQCQAGKHLPRAIVPAEIYYQSASGNLALTRCAGKAHASLSRKALAGKIAALQDSLKTGMPDNERRKLLGRIKYWKTQLGAANVAACITKPVDAVLGTYKTSEPRSNYLLPLEDVDNALGVVGCSVGLLTGSCAVSRKCAPALGLIGQGASLAGAGLKAGVRVAAYPVAKVAEMAERLTA